MYWVFIYSWQRTARHLHPNYKWFRLIGDLRTCREQRRSPTTPLTPLSIDHGDTIVLLQSFRGRIFTISRVLTSWGMVSKYCVVHMHIDNAGVDLEGNSIRLIPVCCVSESSHTKTFTLLKNVLQSPWAAFPLRKWCTCLCSCYS